MSDKPLTGGAALLWDVLQAEPGALTDLLEARPELLSALLGELWARALTSGFRTRQDLVDACQVAGPWVVSSASEAEHDYVVRHDVTTGAIVAIVRPEAPHTAWLRPAAGLATEHEQRIPGEWGRVEDALGAADEALTDEGWRLAGRVHPAPPMDDEERAEAEARIGRH